MSTADNNESLQHCYFCGKASEAVRHLLAGEQAAICDACILLGMDTLQGLLPQAKMQYTHELLDWHFGSLAPDHLIKTRRTYPGRMRADLQDAVAALFDPGAIRIVGIKSGQHYETTDLTELWRKGQRPQVIAPLSFEEIDIGECAPKRCQVNGLWLREDGELRYAVLLSKEQDYHGGSKMSVEISGPQGDAITQLTRRLFDAIERCIHQAQSYRGKVLSLDPEAHFDGSANAINVHTVPPVSREQLILPDKTINELERTIIRFSQQREQLRALGLSTKRGVLFYGPPGTGKTHTIRYLATELHEHTTLLITAEQVGLLSEYISIARLLQPSIVVIEDADLLARARETMHSPGEEALLNRLLNEMDGLKEDADILFVLSTNRPESLEEALISRPGRIDQLIEFPRPDAECRRRLIGLYRGRLQVPDDLVNDMVQRTEGVSAAFIKELMRRLAQYSLERGSEGDVIKADLELGMGDMVLSLKPTKTAGTH